jgi:hypothetical protein
MRYSKAREAI